MKKLKAIPKKYKERCSFCQKSLKEVNGLVACLRASICGGCVLIARDVIFESMGNPKGESK